MGTRYYFYVVFIVFVSSQLLTYNYHILLYFALKVDGIYPKLARFLLTVSDPVHLIDCIFGAWQEARRKDIERAFGVHQRKFHCVVRPFEKWEVTTAASAAKRRHEGPTNSTSFERCDVVLPKTVGANGPDSGKSILAYG